MKELTIEEKAQRYDEAIKIAREINDEQRAQPFYVMTRVFPELKESEDEGIRKEIITYLSTVEDKDLIPYESWIAWLEKQGKQKLADKYNITGIKSKHAEGKLGEMIKKMKSTDKVEPKFHEGEWITNGDYTWKIVEVKPLDYILQSQDDNIVDDTISHVDEQFHFFTIEDAKDGDVLCTYECDKPKIVFILKGKPKKHYALSYHCYYNIMYPHFGPDSEKGCLAPNDEDVKPATKEQCDLLFQKMKEAGYEWDAYKKELKKIEQKPAEWSEDDEQYLLVCKNALRKYQVTDKWDSNIISQWLDNKLKSLRPQNTCKPSDVQIKACKEVYADILSAKGFDLGTVNSELNRMEEELKKLKG